MTSDEPVVVTGLAMPGELGTATFLNRLAEAVHSALRAAQQGWAATQEDGPGEADRPYHYEDPADSRVAAQVAATAMVEYLRGPAFARAAVLPPELIGEVLARVRYKPGWTFEPSVLPDGTVAVRAVVELDDHRHPGRVFRTSRIAPLTTAGMESPARVVLEAALRAVLAIEEHESREQLHLEGDGSLPLDPHHLATPTNQAPRPGAGEADLR